MNIRELADQAGLREAVLLRLYGTEDALCDSEIAVLRQIEKFAELVAAHEREECIQNVLQQYEGFGKDHQGVEYVKRRIVDAIRARSKT